MDKKRNINIDYIKCVAAFMVIFFHFFLNTGFNDITSLNHFTLISFILRQIGVICVPLFLLVTGYLMCDKNISKKYYFNLLNVISTYILISIICVFFRKYVLLEQITLEELIFGIFTFKANKYSWYVNMYIGLYLFIPFFNIIIEKIRDNSKMFLYLIILLIFFTSIPKLCNILFFGVNIYPITYYFIGAYLKNYSIKLNLFWLILLFVCMLLIECIFALVCGANLGIFFSNNIIFNLIKACSVFVMLMSLKLKSNNLVNKISKHTLSIYLVSFIVDTLVYGIFNKIFLIYNVRYQNIYIVFIIFAISFFIALIVDFINMIMLKKLRKKANL